MQTKIIPSYFIIYHSEVVTLRKLKQLLELRIDQKLLEEAKKQEIKTIGPIQWNYYDTDGDPDKEFTLEIAYPVDKPGTDRQFKFKSLPSIRCAYTVFTGLWKNLSEAYSELIPQMQKEGLRLTGNCREIYLEINFPDSVKNVTEVQVQYM